jgi:hypothetical protein
MTDSPMEALTARQAAELIGQLQGMLDSVPEDIESAADGALRSRVEALILGYRLGAGTTTGRQIYT